MSDETAPMVLAAERRRCAAMLANDPAALDALLDRRLCFSHATGAVDDKALYLAKMAAGRIDYLSIDWRDAAVVPVGETALLAGRMTSQVRVEGVESGSTTGSWRSGPERIRNGGYLPSSRRRSKLEGRGILRIAVHGSRTFADGALWDELSARDQVRSRPEGFGRANDPRAAFVSCETWGLFPGV